MPRPVRSAYRDGRVTRAALLAAAVAGANAILPDMSNVHRDRMANGVTVLAAPGAGPVTVEAWIGGGMGDEADGDATPGIAHLAEHVALAIAGARLGDARAAVGLDGWVTPDATVFRAIAPAGDVERAVAAVALAAGARGEVSSAIVTREQARIAREGVDDAPARGGARDVAAWWQTSYAPSRTTVAVRGGRAADVVAAVAARWPRASARDHAMARRAPMRVRRPGSAGATWRRAGVDVSDASARERAALSLAAAALRARGHAADLVVTRDAVLWIAGPGAAAAVAELVVDDAALAWARAALRVPLAGVETAIGELAAGQHLFGDPAWADRWRAEVARVAPDDVAAAVRAHVVGRALPAARRAPVTPPRRPAARVVRRATLANGARVVAVRVPGATRVAVRVAWRGGFADEGPAQRGVVALLAAAAPATCADIDAAAETAALGGELAGVAGRWTFGIRSRWTTATWKEGLALAAACARAPALDVHVVRHERARLVELATGVARSPARVAFTTYLRARWGGDPLGNDALASPGELAALTRAAAAQWWREHYALGGAVIAAAGDVDPDRAIAEVKATFASSPGETPAAAPRPPSPPAPAPTPTPSPTSPSQLFVDGPAGAAALVVGLPGLAAAHADRRALDALVAILADPGGRLRRAAAAHGAFGVRVTAAGGPAAGYVAIELAADPPADAALAAVEEVVRALGVEGPTAAELAVAEAALAIADDDPLAIADAAARAALAPDAPTAAPAPPTPLDAATLQRVAASVLRWDDATIVTVRPPAMTPGARAHAEKRVKPGRRTRHGARR